MTDLQNEFTWSISRDNMFKTCKKKYYFNYYGSWGGWEAGANKFARKCYILKNITSFPMWAGTIIHDLLEENIKRIKNGEEKLTLKQVKRKAVRNLKKGWKESLRGKWKRSPKRAVNLFEHYYNKSIEQNDADKLKDKIFTCLENFYSSDIYKEIESLKDPSTLSVEEMNSFEIDGIKIWVIMDCAYEMEGTFKIIDWKTGKQKESYKHQVATYAIYANEVLDYPYENIKTLLYFLLDDELLTFDVDTQGIDEVKIKIRNSIDEMQEILDDAENNRASIENFEKDLSKCARCRFKEVCKNIDNYRALLA